MSGSVTTVTSGSTLKTVDSDDLSDGITVALRVRPLSNMEVEKKERFCFKFPGRGQAQINAQNVQRTYTFDTSFEPDANQQDIFEHSGVKRLVELSVEGFSCTCFAYGQTGSGKTHTMTGPPQDFLLTPDPDPSHFGIIPRSFVYLFQLIKTFPQSKFRIHVSYFEIYNEQVIDLLNPHPMYALNVRWRKEIGFYVDNLFVIECESVDDIMGVMETGMKNRAFNPTSPNEFSSRSHSMLTVRLDCESPDPDDPRVTYSKHGKLTFVDLAGSEKLKDGVAVSTEQFQETHNINKSLLVLGNCISILGDPKKRGQHVPFRDSKLTKLLSDSLGGNGVTLMIACVSPGSGSTTETLNTVRYASRAKRITSQPTVQLDPHEEMLRNLKEEVRRLRKENKALKEQHTRLETERRAIERKEVVRDLDSPDDDNKSKVEYVVPLPGSRRPNSSTPLPPIPPGRGHEEESPHLRGSPQIEGRGNRSTASSKEHNVDKSLYEMLQEYMVENEGLRTENSDLHNHRDKFKREHDLLTRENEVLIRKLEDLKRTPGEADRPNDHGDDHKRRQSHVDRTLHNPDAGPSRSTPIGQTVTPDNQMVPYRGPVVPQSRGHQPPAANQNPPAQNSYVYQDPRSYSSNDPTPVPAHNQQDGYRGQAPNQQPITNGYNPPNQGAQPPYNPPPRQQDPYQQQQPPPTRPGYRANPPEDPYSRAPNPTPPTYNPAQQQNPYQAPQQNAYAPVQEVYQQPPAAQQPTPPTQNPYQAPPPTQNLYQAPPPTQQPYQAYQPQRQPPVQSVQPAYQEAPVQPQYNGYAPIASNPQPTRPTYNPNPIAQPYIGPPPTLQPLIRRTDPYAPQINPNYPRNEPYGYEEPTNDPRLAGGMPPVRRMPYDAGQPRLAYPGMELAGQPPHPGYDGYRPAPSQQSEPVANVQRRSGRPTAVPQGQVRHDLSHYKDIYDQRRLGHSPPRENPTKKEKGRHGSPERKHKHKSRSRHRRSPSPGDDDLDEINQRLRSDLEDLDHIIEQTERTNAFNHRLTLAGKR